MADPVNQATIDLIKKFEGCRLQAYQDSIGILTIGYGHTNNVQMGDIITQEQAEQFLRDDLHFFEDAVDNMLAEDADTSDNQFGAMVSLTYNIGALVFSRSHVLLFHNAGKFQDAANAFLAFDHAGGQRLPGLTRRRIAERALYLADDET